MKQRYLLLNQGITLCIFLFYLTRTLLFKKKYLLLLLQIPLLHAQEKRTFFNEFAGGVNYTVVHGANEKGKTGFGVAFYFSSVKRRDNMFNPTFGIEINETNQWKKKVYHDHLTDNINVVFQTTYASLMYVCRFNQGKRTRFFEEAGLLGDFYLGGSEKGDFVSYGNLSAPVSGTYTNKARYAEMNISPSLGIGLKIPFGTHQLVLRCAYRHGVFDLRKNNGSETLYSRYVLFSAAFRI